MFKLTYRILHVMRYRDMIVAVTPLKWIIYTPSFDNALSLTRNVDEYFALMSYSRALNRGVAHLELKIRRMLDIACVKIDRLASTVSTWSADHCGHRHISNFCYHLSLRDGYLYAYPRITQPVLLNYTRGMSAYVMVVLFACIEVRELIMQVLTIGASLHELQLVIDAHSV